MGRLRMKSASISDNPELKAPKFNFSQYDSSGNTAYCNNEEIIDFVTDGNSLYVCVVPSVRPTKANIAEQEGFLKLVSQGPQGIRGPKGEDGTSAVTPKIDASFDDDQLRIRVNGETKALSPSLTGPTWKPVLEDNILTWELTDDRYMPESVDLMNLRPIQKSPLLLRTNSDNTKLSDEASGPANFIQWKYEGDPYWTNLISISELMNLALAGVSIWKATDGKWHFGHREVVRANYISDKNGRKIISNVRLGDVLFDAGELPFAESAGGNDYGTDIDLIYQKLMELEAAMVKTVNHEGPDPSGNVNVETGSDISLDGYATENWVSSNYQPKGNYVKKVTVNGNSYTPNASTGEVDLGNIGGNGGNVDTSDCVKSVTINGTTKTPVDGNVSFTISVGETPLFDVRFDNSTHKLQKTTDGQTWIDLVDLDDYTGGGLTEAQVKALIGKILEGLDAYIPDEYVRGNDHNYFIRLSDLANYTTVDDVAAMIRDAMTNQNVDYYRVFTLYQRTDSPTIAPAKPVVGVWEWNTAANEDTIALKANAQSAWNNHPDNATVAAPYLWITSATYSYLTKSEINTNNQNPWETPICLTAQDGQDGVDGDSVEFMYILCTDTEFNNIKNTTPVPEHGDNRPDDLPTYTTPSGNGWTDHPSGISETYQIEAVSIRTKDDGTWSSYSNPTIWSMWGEDGMDGDGVEYIFAVAAENETSIDAQTGKRELNASFFRGQSATQILPLTDQEVTTLGASYQISDWCPDGTTKQGYLMPDLNWTDNPSDVGPDQPYEFVAIRKKKLDPVSGQMKWGPFSTPALWGFWGQKTVTVIESGNVYRHPYTCFAFTRSATDITGYTVINPWTYNNITYAAWIAADNTREEGYYSNPLSYVVTLDDNNQVVSSANLTWNDTIPAPPGQLYMITNHIGDEGSGNDQGWTSPRAWGDASGFQVEYANSSTATDNVYNKVIGYTLPRLDNYDLDNYPNLNDPDNDGIDEAAWRTAVQTAGMGVWGDENDITDPDYMATCYKKQEGVWSNWQISRIKGERGDDSDIPGPAGKDGADIEFVYFRTDAEDHRPGMSDTYGTYDGQTKISEDLYEDDFFPMATGAFLSNPNVTKDTELHIGNDLFWHDHPAGVTEQLPCEWVGMRHSSYDLQGNKVWGEFNIALWSKYGANGRDGDGIEYVFFALTSEQHEVVKAGITLSGTNYNGKLPVSNVDISGDSNHGDHTKSEFLPNSIAINATLPAIRAVDDNPGGTDIRPYVYCSQRKYNGQTSTWGNFGPASLWVAIEALTDPTLVTLDINNSQTPVQVDDTDHVVIGEFWITNASNMFNCLRTNSGVLWDWGAIHVGQFVNGEPVFSNTPDVIFNSNGEAVLSNAESLDGNVRRKIVSASGDEHRYYEFSLSVQFINNVALTETYVVPIKVVDSDNEHYGIDYIKFNPVHTDKIVTLNYLSQTNVIKKDSRDATIYSPNSITILPSGPDDSFDSKRNVVYSYAIDGRTEIKFDQPVFIKSDVILSKSVYVYYDAQGNQLSSSTSDLYPNIPNNCFAILHLWNTDDNQREWDEWLSSMNVKLNGTLIEDKITLGCGWYHNNTQEITDREDTYVIYPDKIESANEYYFVSNEIIHGAITSSVIDSTNMTITIVNEVTDLNTIQTQTYTNTYNLVSKRPVVSEGAVYDVIESTSNVTVELDFANYWFALDQELDWGNESVGNTENTGYGKIRVKKNNNNDIFATWYVLPDSGSIKLVGYEENYELTLTKPLNATNKYIYCATHMGNVSNGSYISNIRLEQKPTPQLNVFTSQSAAQSGLSNMTVGDTVLIVDGSTIQSGIVKGNISPTTGDYAECIKELVINT